MKMDKAEHLSQPAHSARRDTEEYRIRGKHRGCYSHLTSWNTAQAALLGKQTLRWSQQAGFIKECPGIDICGRKGTKAGWAEGKAES